MLISYIIVSITKYSLVIGSARAYLLRNCSAVTWVSNYSCPMGLMHNYVIQCMRVRLGGIAKQVPPFFRECVFHFYILATNIPLYSETVWNKRRIKFNPPPEEE